ncbi:hypothetical protein ACTJKC_24945 [Pedobacter sp. 22226]|uniref:hypothetical protein n=1 Tax=Pedobacter sp. 22226 TaxID=3453894 RepID=UPI003F8490F4
MSFLASNTLIAVPGGLTPISNLKIGDLALAWTATGVLEKAIIFSSGSEPGGRLTAMFIRTENSTLIVGLDQKMFLADQTLKKAHELIPGRDRLFKADGKSEEIKGVFAGTYHNGGHSCGHRW